MKIKSLSAEVFEGKFNEELYREYSYWLPWIVDASYTGGGSLTMNIYVNAPVVGSAGMEEFAIMLRKEFEAIGYYNVA